MILHKKCVYIIIYIYIELQMGTITLFLATKPPNFGRFI